MAGGVERTLRRRIRSVQATKKITRAFELIAASQIVRAQNRIAANRPFKEGMRRIVMEAARDDEGARALMGVPESPKKVTVALIVGDRGLSGPYNSSVLRAAEARVAHHRAAGAEVEIVAVGRKAAAYLRFRGREVSRSFVAMADRPSFAQAREVAAELWAPFGNHQVDLVELVSTRYRSAGSQSVEVLQLLPLPPHEGEAEGLSSPTGGYIEFEPDAVRLIGELVYRYLESETFSALLEASASEHASRQRAMAAATDNADELIRTYTRTMNRARQDTITNEIMEIVGGAEALRSAKGAT
ncbi:MAG: ATP synthase F1 subunit gamma [Acidimicrobiales bacterium]